MSDEQVLIDQCLSGQSKAQKELYDKYSSHWYMICLRYLKNKTTAEDIMQNGLVKIFTKLSSFDSTKSLFKTWSSKIMVNEFLQYFRGKKIQYENADIADSSELNISYSDDPIHKISAQEITTYIQALPAGYRLVFNLVAIEGYTHIEVGERLGIKPGTSKSQFFKARNLLKTQLTKLYGFHGVVL